MPYRSRLQKIEEKRDFRKGVVIFSLVAVIIFLGGLYGIQVLARLAVFIDRVRSSGRPIDSMDTIPPAPPVLWADYSATNSAKIDLYASSEPGAIVYLILNKEKIRTSVTSENGGVIFSGISLNMGNNVFQAVGVDSSGNRSQLSREIGIIYSTKIPKLDIEKPQDNQSFSGGQNLLEVKGTTDPNNRLTINGRIAIVGADGKFVLFVRLNQGDNLINVKSSDVYGNILAKDIKVVYTP